MPYEGTASCACGQVRFEVRGDPVLGVQCACNDCRAGASFVDAKAKAAGCRNTSAFERGSKDQVVFNCLFPHGGIKLVKGGELLRKFRLRDGKSAVHTYTDCCKTSVVNLCGPFIFVKMGVGVPFNYNTLSPPPPVSSRFARVNLQDAPLPAAVPKDKLVNMKGGPPLGLLPIVLWHVLLAPHRFTDAATRALLAERCSIADVTEVAGDAAYIAAGYDASGKLPKV